MENLIIGAFVLLVMEISIGDLIALVIEEIWDLA